MTMETILKIAKEFVGDQDGCYEYIGELENGKHFISYMFSDDTMNEEGIALCVGGPQYIIVIDGLCRHLDNNEYERTLRYLASIEYYKHQIYEHLTDKLKVPSIAAKFLMMEYKDLLEDFWEEGAPVAAAATAISQIGMDKL